MGVVYFGAKTGTAAPVTLDDQVKLTLDSNKHDWGTIAINGGIVSKSFPVGNGGSAPLKLYEITTSCMCTTAQLITAKQSSEKFGMHQKTPAVFEIQPGETAELLIEFDPAFHGPSGLGPITRTVSGNTNDPKSPQLSFQLSANVINN